MATLKLNGADIYYEEEGSGPAIIFTHGHSMYHKQWMPQIDFFSNSYRTIVWDVRGHGYSSLPEGEVDPELFSKDLAALMEKLQLPSAILCGLSMGGIFHCKRPSVTRNVCGRLYSSARRSRIRLIGLRSRPLRSVVSPRDSFH